VVGKRCIAEWGGDESQRFGIPPKQLRRQGGNQVGRDGAPPGKAAAGAPTGDSDGVLFPDSAAALSFPALSQNKVDLEREREREREGECVWERGREGGPGIDWDRERMAKTIASCSIMLRTTLSIPCP
jgi:hypothetical protein